MTRLNNSTQQAQNIIHDFNYYVTMGNGAKSIFTAYGRMSQKKIDTFNRIEQRAKATEGYNHDLVVGGHNSNFYSTLYSFTDKDGHRHIVKDTYANTFEIVL